jgi:hypothetical protein
MGVAVDYVWMLGWWRAVWQLAVEHGAKLHVPPWAERNKRDMVEGTGLAKTFSSLVKVNVFLFF